MQGRDAILVGAAPPDGRGWLPARLRASEIWFIGLSIVVGGASGLTAVLLAALAHGLQAKLFGFSFDDRLSALPQIAPVTVLWLPMGGAVLGFVTWATLKWRGRHLIDVVEANALHGGILSLRDSIAVCGQTLISNGFGGSVGLEAAYAQAGGAIASQFGQRLKVRRGDLRTLVGAGAGAAIGAAFGAPLAGAFYAFEVVIGSYAPSMIAPVAAASLTSVMVAHMAGAAPYSIDVRVAAPPDALGYFLYSLLGGVCAVAGIGLMRLVAVGDDLARRSRLPAPARPVLAGALLAGLALLSPQVLSSGHGALHADLAARLGLESLATIFALKATASIIALSLGFRGGLFFAALFLGSLLGQMFADLSTLTGLIMPLEPESAALVGMGALAVAVVGGPLTMSFLVLETTRDFGVAAATLAACLVASAIVRERFGYSLSTWRMHLRGETIRSARDVGWMRALTAERLMRPAPVVAASTSVADFRRQFPLGSEDRVVLLDGDGRYAGMAVTAAAYDVSLLEEAPVRELAIDREKWLSPGLNIEEVMSVFDGSVGEELPVLDSDHHVHGVVSELLATRRYAQELEQAHQGLFGET